MGKVAAHFIAWSAVHCYLYLVSPLLYVNSRNIDRKTRIDDGKTAGTLHVSVEKYSASNAPVHRCLKFCYCFAFFPSFLCSLLLLLVDSLVGFQILSCENEFQLRKNQKHSHTNDTAQSWLFLSIFRSLSRSFGELFCLVKLYECATTQTVPKSTSIYWNEQLLSSCYNNCCCLFFLFLYIRSGFVVRYGTTDFICIVDIHNIVCVVLLSTLSNIIRASWKYNTWSTEENGSWTQFQ